MSENRHVAVEHLPESIREEASTQSAGTASAEAVGEFKTVSLKEAMEEPERRIIEAALKANNWNRQTTAETLQINRTTLYKKMKHYGLEYDPAKHGSQ